MLPSNSRSEIAVFGSAETTEGCSWALTGLREWAEGARIVVSCLVRPPQVYARDQDPGSLTYVEPVSKRQNCSEIDSKKPSGVPPLYDNGSYHP